MYMYLSDVTIILLQKEEIMISRDSVSIDIRLQCAAVHYEIP